MKVGELISLVLIALALPLVGLHTRHAWSQPGSATLPWLCSATALAVLVVALLSALTGKRVAELRLSVLWPVFAAFVMIGAIGIAVDGYPAGARGDLYLSLAEWLGFAVILLVLLLAPRRQKADMPAGLSSRG